MGQPLKRHESLKPLSRDHHQGLLLCWKIREGLKRKVECDRIKAYNDFFFTSQLRPHFRFEESEIFPLLKPGHPMVERAINDHRRIEDLFKEEGENTVFNTIETELTKNIRFEERVLFQELQNVLSTQQLQQIINKEEEIITPHPDDWEDKYWLK